MYIIPPSDDATVARLRRSSPKEPACAWTTDSELEVRELIQMYRGTHMHTHTHNLYIYIGIHVSLTSNPNPNPVCPSLL